MYLAAERPLGVHSGAVKFVMNSRGTSQLDDRARFDLWRAANCRLQARQLQSGEPPDPGQVQMLSRLNTERPDIHVAADIMLITSLCAEARSLLSKCESMQLDGCQLGDALSQLLFRMRDAGNAASSWTSGVSALWRPTSVCSPTALQRNSILGNSPEHPVPMCDFFHLLTYSSSWYAYIWNFHAAAQIMLHEQIQQLQQLQATLFLCDSHGTVKDNKEREATTARQLALSILQSIPAVIGLTDAAGTHVAPPAGQGRVAGRFLALFAVNTVSKSSLVTAQQRLVARNIVAWIHATHALP